MAEEFAPILAPAPIANPGFRHLFAGTNAERSDGYLAYKGRFKNAESAKLSFVSNGYEWGQICVFEVNTFWCVEDYGIDSTVDGWRIVDINEPYKRR